MRKTIAIAGGALLLAGTGTVAATARGKTVDPAADPHLVPMEELSVPIIDGDRLDGAFMLNVVLAMPDAAAAERAAADMPHLRSASLAAALEFSRLYASPMRAVDTELLSENLAEALQNNGAGVSRVLIVKVAARPV
jgi:PBP1b-binding outer membrane lipoprotein LpoB